MEIMRIHFALFKKLIGQRAAVLLHLVVVSVSASASGTFIEDLYWRPNSLQAFIHFHSKLPTGRSQHSDI